MNFKSVYGQPHHSVPGGRVRSYQIHVSEPYAEVGVRLVMDTAACTGDQVVSGGLWRHSVDEPRTYAGPGTAELNGVGFRLAKEYE